MEASAEPFQVSSACGDGICPGIDAPLEGNDVDDVTMMMMMMMMMMMLTNYSKFHKTYSEKVFEYLFHYTCCYCMFSNNVIPFWP